MKIKEYSFISDTEDDFIAYLKDCVAPAKRNKSTSWQFVFTDQEIDYLFNKI